jgi:type I restriction enzyme R subunit
LTDGVKDGYLLSPIVVDVRSDVTTQLLSDQGYAVLEENDDGKLQEKYYNQKDFEKKFFSDPTNRLICETFLDNALCDPLSGEIGKSIIFCVSQNHAAKITKILNELTDKRFPGKYNSDFALQVTSRITNSQSFSVNFQNNNLNGQTNFLEGYKSSKTRICVTVGMMTTGYDCTDVLNLALLRPIFSPTDFIQIKGRGTRKHSFKYSRRVDGEQQEFVREKEHFKLFDYFANCEYFEEKFNYDEVLKLPKESEQRPIPPIPIPPGVDDNVHNYEGIDLVKELTVTPIGYAGMKIDRMMFDRFAETIKEDDFIKEKIAEDDFQAVEEYIRDNIFNKPEDFLNLEKLRTVLKYDWRPPFRQILELIFNKRKSIKGKQEVLDEEFDKFLAIYQPASSYVPLAKRFFKAYITDEEIRMIINQKEYAKLATSPKITMQDLVALNDWREVIPQYVKDYVPLNNFIQ